jgi:putative ABC transport system substrate-binding protein
VRRRDFIVLIGGAAAWPLGAGAQVPERTRRIAVLRAGRSEDPEVQRRSKAFRDELEKLGWVDNQNIHFEERVPAGNVEETNRLAMELVSLVPDVILAVGAPSTVAFSRLTRSIPIVFVVVSDPVGWGLVKSLTQPGGNITGFTDFEFSLAGKWLEVLKEMVADLRRVGIVYFDFEGAQPYSRLFLESVTAAAASLTVESHPLPVHGGSELERVLASFAEKRNGALIFLPDIFTLSHRRLVIDLAARYRLPAIYSADYFAKEGGLVSYGVDTFDLYWRAARYTDQILRGAKPSDLPIQQPTKFKIVVNLKTANALGLDMPPRCLSGPTR